MDNNNELLKNFYFAGLCGLSLMNEESLLQLDPALNISKRAHEFLKNLHKTWNS